MTPAMTRPMSRMLVALDLGDDVVDDLLDLLLGHRLGHELLEDLELVLLVLGLLLATGRTECFGGLAAALALALEHLQLLVVGKRALKLLLRALQRVQDEAQRVAPVLVAREARVLQLALDAGDEAHRRLQLQRARQLARVEAASEDVPVEMEDRLAAALADVDEHLVVVEPRGGRRVRDEAQHPSGFLVREGLDVAERVDVPRGQDEQVRLRDRVDVADRDEPVGRVDVVALRDEPAEQAVLRRRRQGSPPRRLRRRGPAGVGRPRRREATACSRRRTRDPAGRRGRDRSSPASTPSDVVDSSSESARSRALRSFFSSSRHGVGGCGRRSGSRRVRERVNARDARPRGSRRGCA